jgi:hypothetical protein
MRLITTLIFCLLGSSAMAQQCDRWTASMEEDEGGPRMLAAICARANSSKQNAQHDLFVECGAGNGVSIRFLPYAGEGYPPDGNQEYKTDVTFAVGQQTFALSAHYEDMDGALVMDADLDTPLVKALLSGKQVTLSDSKSDKVPAVTFPLKGVSKAFDKLMKTCQP